jgi:hypothetical protein
MARRPRADVGFLASLTQVERQHSVFCTCTKTVACDKARLKRAKHMRHSGGGWPRVMALETGHAICQYSHGHMEKAMSRTQIVAVGLYVLLLLMCGALFVVGDKLSLTARDALLPIASESFKVILGALIGAISAVLGVGANQNR